MSIPRLILKQQVVIRREYFVREVFGLGVHFGGLFVASWRMILIARPLKLTVLTHHFLVCSVPAPDRQKAGIFLLCSKETSQSKFPCRRQ